ncbi:OmpA family protein [Loktanella sp. Alg231-35]|uniref:OmpA family protein n=1 Tax=Loktanella sp. Alg231-35 TaxID=1922220 RepID=UPI000D55514B|nr:OmpA family protein [Loktanella sp. Alg231-35]
MRTSTLTFLCLLAAAAGPTLAQEDTTDTDAMTEEVMEEMADETMAEDAMEDETMSEDTMAEDTMAEETMADDTMAEDTMEEEMAEEETMAEDVMQEATPSLEEIAAADPNLEVAKNEDGEVDAMVMLSDVLFSFGDASLEASSLETLRGVADKLDGVTAIEITGHTDAIGDESFNEALGQRRADAVRDWLIANTDLAAEVVTSRGVGETDPIAPNLTEDGADNPAGRAQNRRVEFTLPDAG